LDRWADDPLPDGCVGEIRLSDLALALEKSGSLSVEVTVETEDGFYTATLHPSSAMGRDGRDDQGIRASLESLPLESRRVAAIDQIRTLPVSDENPLAARLRLSDALDVLDVRDRTAVAAALSPGIFLYADPTQAGVLLSCLESSDAETLSALSPVGDVIRPFVSLSDVADAGLSLGLLARISDPDYKMDTPPQGLISYQDLKNLVSEDKALLLWVLNASSPEFSLDDVSSYVSGGLDSVALILKASSLGVTSKEAAGYGKSAKVLSPSDPLSGMLTLRDAGLSGSDVAFYRDSAMIEDPEQMISLSNSGVSPDTATAYYSRLVSPDEMIALHSAKITPDDVRRYQYSTKDFWGHKLYGDTYWSPTTEPEDNYLYSVRRASVEAMIELRDAGVTSELYVAFQWAGLSYIDEMKRAVSRGLTVETAWLWEVERSEDVRQVLDSDMGRHSFISYKKSGFSIEDMLKLHANGVSAYDASKWSDRYDLRDSDSILEFVSLGVSWDDPEWRYPGYNSVSPERMLKIARKRKKN
jgi:hypothetical protein